MYTIKIIPRTLHFKQPAGTSRGVYLTRKVWYLVLQETGTGRYGIGECAPLPALSCDDIPDYEYPSMLFGLETAFCHLRAGSLRFWNTPFSEGKQGIPINGLIWMGNFDEMYRRIEEKMKAGFRCIKVKIGAIDFERELELLAHIRQHFSPQEIENRTEGRCQRSFLTSRCSP